MKTHVGRTSKTIACLAIALFGSRAHALLIDDFSTGPYSTSLVSVGAMDTAFQSASVLGSTRTTKLYVEANPLSRPVDLIIGSNAAVVNSGTMADNWVRFAYGFENNGSGGLVVDPLNQNLSAFDSFFVEVLGNDLDTSLKVYVATLNGTVLEVSTCTVTVAGSNSPNQFTVAIPFSGFSGIATWTDADVIVFEFDNTPSGDFAIGNLSAVPEPATLAVLGLGWAPIIRRRKARGGLR